MSMRVWLWVMGCLGVSLAAFGWVQEPSPLSAGHLAIVRPMGFTDAAGKPVLPARTAGVPFEQTIKVAAPVQVVTPVRAAGKYTLWVRVAEGKPQNPLTVELLRDGKAALKGTVNDGAGTLETGGATAFEAYRDEALKHNVEGGADPGAELLDGDKGIGDIIDDINQEANPELRWINSARIEDLKGGAYYWWKVGVADLAPARYTLRLSGGPGLFNAAFLTTATDITYPYAGDIDITPASFIRFRVDRVPRGGLTISAGLRIHTNPYFQTGTGYFSDTEMKEKAGDPIKKTGYTAWYRLQDLENCPGFGAGTGHLMVNVPASAQGATQFAVFPHEDEVLREFAWNEPEGTNISLLTDFKTYLSSLRTFRDHAREHYDYALAGSLGRLFPLTRGPLYFNPNGGAREICGDYANKTLRLIGVNVAAAPFEQDKRRRYGFKSASGHYCPPVYLPYDLEAAKAAYAKYYDVAFGKGLDDETVLFQSSDEPGEFSTEQMTAPYWRFYPKDKGGPKWVDHTGGSDLNYQRADMSDCVLEGSILKLGGSVGFRVGFSNVTNPTDGMVWTVGRVSQDGAFTMSVGKPDQPYPKLLKKPEARIDGTKPTPFKIVYEGTSAALYLNDKLVHYITDLPAQGGLGITGGTKALTALAIRPIRAKERGVAAPEMADPDVDAGGGLDFGDDDETPDWATPKPLEQFVKEDCVQAGGIPEARVGFRKWAAAQGLKPELFGKKTWDDVNMLTVKELIETDADRRLYYWSRRYAGWLTPMMFGLAADGIRNAAPNKDIKAFVGLSGHSFYFPSQMPLDMFGLAAYGGPSMPGISDAMSMGGWRWDSHQSVAFSVAPYNGGAKQYGANWGKPPVSMPMMHAMWPNVIRAYVQVANNVKYQSYWCWGPEYLMTEWYWSEGADSYEAVASICNHTAQVDDILSPGRMRDSRVAMLYAMSHEYWGGQSAFTDKRAAFLGLSHGYYQPYLVNEDQLTQDALDHYDALYVLDPHVSAAAQAKIDAFVQRGGLLWICADAARYNEYGDNLDLLQKLAGLTRTYTDEKRDWTMVPAAGETAIHKQDALPSGVDTVTCPGGTVRARYGDGRIAWVEKTVGKGKVVYLTHRAGHNYSNKATRPGGVQDIWSDIIREPLVLPLNEVKVDRELIVSQPAIVASPLSTDAGTVIVLYNMQGGTPKNLTFSLKEPKRPVSVQTFDEKWSLVDLPFDYADGRVSMTLASLPRENMIVVRRTPAPADTRVEQMRQNAVAMLGMPGWEDISAGAWYAGFYPEWKLADKLPPLLTHEHYMVRRQAAESIGRLRYTAAADALAAQIAKEQDAHALGDMLYALAQLGDARFPALAQATMSASIQAQTRKQILRGAVLYLKAKQAAGALDDRLKTAGAALAEDGDADLDRRVYLETAPLFALLDPAKSVTRWQNACLPGSEDRLRDALTSQVAANDALFETAIKALPADGNVLISLAQQRTDPRLAVLLTQRMDELMTLNGGGYFWAAARQADPALAKVAFAKRATLPDSFKPYLYALLERTFNARLGNVEADWAAYLAK